MGVAGSGARLVKEEFMSGLSASGWKPWEVVVVIAGDEKAGTIALRLRLRLRLRSWELG